MHAWVGFIPHFLMPRLRVSSLARAWLAVICCAWLLCVPAHAQTPPETTPVQNEAVQQVPADKATAEADKAVPAQTTELANTPVETAAKENSAPPSTTQQSTAPQISPMQSNPLQPSPVRNAPALPGIGQIVISLALVLGAVLLLGFLYKKMQLKLPGNQHFRVVATLNVGQRERLLVIEMQGKQRVLGVTAQQINFLFELETPLSEEKLASDFHTQLQSFLKK